MCPISCLQKEEELTPEQIQFSETKVNLIQAYMKQDPIQPFMEEEAALSEPVKGGPKTSELLEYEHIPKDQLLSELDFDKTLTDEQLKPLHEVILQNHNAFGLNKRLGNFPAKVNI